MKIIYTLILVLILIVPANELHSAWRKITNIEAGYVDNTYLDIYFLPSNPNLGWACGYNALTIRTTDGGKSWFGSRLLRNGQFPFSAQLESIMFVNEKVGFTSGSGTLDTPVIYKSTDGGETWFDVTPPDVENIWGNYFLNENVGIVVGGGCGRPQKFYRTSDGGQTWASKQYNITGSKMADAILLEEDGLAFAIGSGTLWKSTDGGRNWKTVSNTGNDDWHEEITRKGTTLLIPYSIGCDGNIEQEAGGIRITHNDGKTWSQYSTGWAMFGSFLLDENHGWASGFNRTMIYTSNGGKTWSLENCGIHPEDNLDDIWFINDTTGWVVGEGVYEYFTPHPTAPEITIKESKFICEGSSVTLFASDGFDDYLWSDGQRGKSIKVSKPGKYSVAANVDSICYTGTSNIIEIQYYPKIVPEFILSSGGDPCIGDTVTLSLNGKFLQYKWDNGSTDSSIQVWQSRTVNLTVTDSNGCELKTSFPIKFQPLPNPFINVTGRLNFCTGDSVTLSTTVAYSSYRWYEIQSDNLLSDKSSLTVSTAGKYYVIVENSGGCGNNSDTVEVIVRGEKNVLSFSLSEPNSMEFDSSYVNGLKCRMLKIQNHGIKDYFLPQIFIYTNIAFSTPTSQFPIIIPAGSEVNLKICFTPVKLGINIDTLTLGDVCTDYIIKVFGYGITESFEDVTKCDVPLKFELSDPFGKTMLFGLGLPSPNPAGDNVSVSFSTNSNEIKTQDMKLRIYNSMGMEVKSNFNINIASTTDNIKNGQIIFNTTEFLPGLYVFALEIYGNTVTGKFTVLR